MKKFSEAPILPGVGCGYVIVSILQKMRFEQKVAVSKGEMYLVTSFKEWYNQKEND